MWRPDWLDLTSPKYVVRLGQAQVQLWKAHGQRWSLLGSKAANHIAYAQHQAVAAVVADLTSSLPPGSNVHVVADSRWMPLTLMFTGRRPLSQAQALALAKHRFVDVFGEQAQAWNVQANYVSGDEHALAFACPSGLMASVRQGLGLDVDDPVKTGKKNLRSIVPTFSWIWNQTAPRGRGSAWFVVAEQDRSLMAWIQKGRLRAMQTAGPVISSPAHLSALLKTEALRCGVVEESVATLGASLEMHPDMTRVSPVPGIEWRTLAIEEVAA